MNNNLIIITKEDLAQVVRQELFSFQERIEAKNSTRSYSINGVAKLLGRSHSTIKKLVETGILSTTKDDRILESEIENYLNNST